MPCPRCRGRKTEQSGDLCVLCLAAGVVPDVAISRWFRLSEFTHSELADRRGLDNAPDDAQLSNLTRTGAVLDKVRDQFGPIKVNSAFRSRLVNAAVGGASTSAHPDGRAVDFVSGTHTLREIVAWIDANKVGLGVDQVIYEGTWIHLGIARVGERPRHQALQMFAGKYAALDLTDPRVV